MKIVKYDIKKHLDELIGMFMELHNLHVNKRPDDFRMSSLKSIREYLINDCRYNFFICMNNEDIVGFICFNVVNIPSSILFKKSRILDIPGIYVKPFFRGYGFGKSMLNFISGECKKLRCRSIICTVYEFNNISKRMFLKSGFKVSNYRMMKEF